MLAIDLWKMRKVSVDRAAIAVTTQGECIARDLEQPAEDEGLFVVLGAVNDTGKILQLCDKSH